MSDIEPGSPALLAGWGDLGFWRIKRLSRNFCLRSPPPFGKLSSRVRSQGVEAFCEARG